MMRLRYIICSPALYSRHSELGTSPLIEAKSGGGEFAGELVKVRDEKYLHLAIQHSPYDKSQSRFNFS
jgi:hypothetical protein